MLPPQKSRICALLLFTAIFDLISLNFCQDIPYNYHICSSSIGNDDYKSNLSTLLDSLTSKASLSGFGKETSNGIYGLYLCRGDVSNSTCQECVRTAIQGIQQRCPYNTTGTIWYDRCLLRYSNVSFFGVLQIDLMVIMWNVNNITSTDEQSYGAPGLIDILVESTPFKPMKFDTSQFTSDYGTRYALMQCTRDINSTQCKSCLSQLRDYFKQCCGNRIGWRILTSNCFVRYENYTFYEQASTPAPTTPVSAGPQPVPTPPVPAGPQPVPNVGNGGNNTAIIAAISVSSILAVGAFLGFCYCCYCKKRRRGTDGDTSQKILLQDLESSNHMPLEEGMQVNDPENSGEMHYFKLSTIRAATSNFSDVNKLGEGGFGPVYKGKLPNGREIAVKRLSMTSRQGLEEFRNEVMVIVKLQHKNLVRLLGYCLEGDEKLLVYEYLANTSLDAFLFDPKKCKQLDWARRANIITGTARGLLYLHEDSRLKIIHRDLKASNVLLDDEMNPKISDFGTARIFGGNQIEANTDRVVGTYGYMAPEYALEGLISTKSDVYSFGVLMLEVLSGKKNRGFYYPDHAPSLLLQAWQLWNQDRGKELIDPNVIDACPENEVLRWIHIALLCVQDDPAERPTMSQVVLMLGSKSMNLPHLSTAPYSAARYNFMSDQSSTSGTGTGFLTSDQSTATDST